MIKCPQTTAVKTNICCATPGKEWREWSPFFTHGRLGLAVQGNAFCSAPKMTSPAQIHYEKLAGEKRKEEKMQMKG